jgi:hypothetical protein
MAVFGEGGSADKISAADYDRQLHAHLHNLDQFARNSFQFAGLDAETSFGTESFAADFEKDALVDGRSRLGHSRRIIAAAGRLSVFALS